MEIALAALQSRVVAGKLAGGLEGVNTHQVLAGESAAPPCRQQGSRAWPPSPPWPPKAVV
jgi:hypothetical protein